MTDIDLDARLRSGLASRDPGAVPAAFADAVGRVPYEVRRPISATIADSLAGRLGIPFEQGLPAVRMAGVLALLVLALLAVAALIGSRPPDPNELVRLSRAAHEHPPPFTMTTAAFDVPGDSMTFYGCGSIWLDEQTIKLMQLRYAWDGAGHFRQECHYTGSAPGFPPTLDDGFVVLGPDGTGGVWSGDTWIPGPHPGRVAAAPIATVDWLNWSGVPVAEATGGASLPDACNWTPGGRGAVAGRAAWVVSCGDETIWLDAETHLLLKWEHAGDVISEALAFDAGSPPPADRFVLGPPTNARMRLVPGQTPASWTLPRLDGGSLDWSSLRGKPTVVLTRTDNCPSPCLTLRTFLETVEPRLAQVNAVGYAIWTATDVRLSAPSGIARAVGFTEEELALAAGAGIPVVADDGQVASGWEVSHGVELFDAEGRHVATSDPRSESSLGAMIDALVGGGPIPERPPGDGVFSVGSAAPPMVAGLLDGGELDVAALRGRLAAILSPGWLDETTADRVTPLATAFMDACGSLGREIVCVVLTNGRNGSNPLDGWADLRDRLGAEGHPADRVLFAAFPEEDPLESYPGLWGSLLTPSDGFAEDRQALVVIDALGAVAGVTGEPPADVEVLRRLIVSP